MTSHGSHRKTLQGVLAVGILLLQSSRYGSRALAAEPDASDLAAIHDMVEALFERALQSYQITEPDGTTITIISPIMEWDLNYLRHQGDAAVPFIASHLRSFNAKERSMAAGLLGNQGGSRIVEFLRFALRDALPSVRLAAVCGLSGAPFEQARPLLEKTARHDPDADVRKAARKVLETMRID